LLDEPTGDLDSKNTDIVLKLLLDLNGTVMPAVPSSHSQNKRGCV
jgi:ABC-type lipoprotein export system ATPase subunit